MNLLDIFNEVGSTTSKNRKIEILTKYKDIPVLQDVLVAMYDPFVNYWIKKIPDYTPKENGGRGVTWILERIEKLSNRTYTGHDGIGWLKDTLEGTTSSNAIILERIIKRDMRVGISASTINKVWPSLIPQFKIMLAYPQDENTLFKFPVMAQPKEDGMRCKVIVENGSVQFFTRNGKLIQMHNHMNNEFLKICKGDDCVFDGELLVMSNGVILDRKTGNGILNKAVKNTISESEVTGIFITLWDVINYDEFITGKSFTPAITRYSILNSMVNAIHSPVLSNGFPINVIHNRIINSQKELDELFDLMISTGKEGLIVKKMDGEWVNKKSKNWTKMKVDKELDLIVVNWIPGEPDSKYEGMLGALTVQNRDGSLECNVGSGFSDKERETITEECIGNIITIKYNERISNKGSEIESLFLPRFVEFRLDKDEIDL